MKNPRKGPKVKRLNSIKLLPGKKWWTGSPGNNFPPSPHNRKTTQIYCTVPQYCPVLWTALEYKVISCTVDNPKVHSTVQKPYF